MLEIVAYLLVFGTETPGYTDLSTLCLQVEDNGKPEVPEAKVQH